VTPEDGEDITDSVDLGIEETAGITAKGLGLKLNQRGKGKKNGKEMLHTVILPFSIGGRGGMARFAEVLGRSPGSPQRFLQADLAQVESWLTRKGEEGPDEEDAHGEKFNPTDGCNSAGRTPTLEGAKREMNE